MQTELKIQDLALVIRYMAPIEIYINTRLVWADDVDLTDVPEDKQQELITKNLVERDKILARSDLVTGLNFQIVQHHHSQVYITTI